MKTLFSSSLLLAALLLGGCNRPIQLPHTESKVTFDPETGKITSAYYFSTKAQSGFNGDLDPNTGALHVNTDNADAPRGYEDFVEKSAEVEIERIKERQKMFDAAMQAAARGAPGPQ